MNYRAVNYKKLQELKDRLDHANNMIAQVHAHIDMMMQAAKTAGVFEHALSDLQTFFNESVRGPLHKLEVDLYDLIGKNAPRIPVKNVTDKELKLFGKIKVGPGDTYTMKWRSRYSAGIRQLIEEEKLQEVNNDG